MTRFFAEDSESGNGSFAQLLNEAVQPSLMAAPEQMDPWERVVFGGERGGGGKDGFFRENRPLGLMVSKSSFFTVPAGISPAGLLGSPAPNFSSSSAENPYSLLQRLPPPPPSNTNHAAFESTDDETQADQRSIPTSLLVDKPADDGYNWRKYGQKQVKGSEYPRSYYKCTHPSCIVKKKVERALDGHVTEIIYKGQHNHQPPAPNRRGNEIDHPANSETDLQSATNLHLPPKRERESVHRTSEKFPGSNNGEDAGLVWRGVDDGDDNEPDPSRRRAETGIRDSAQSQAVTEPRIIVQTTSEVDLLDDGYRWRKYGQKVVKGNPHPRSYYKCTNTGCNVRKHVERASTDSKAVMTTYEGKHNHVVPVARNSSHQMANGGSVDSMQPNIRVTIANDQLFLKRLEEYKNNIQQQAPIHMKKEYDIA